MAIPAATAAATLMYLSGRWRLPVDYHVLASTARAIHYFRKREKQDRMNAFYAVEDNALNKKIANKVFLKFQGKCWTFKQFYEGALNYAGWLSSVHHVVQGEVVAIDFMNGPEILFLTVALWSLGATPALINYNLSGEPLAHTIRVSSARLFIVEAEVAANVLNPETIAKLSSPTFKNEVLPLQTVTLGQELQTSIAYFKPYRAPDSSRSGVTGRHPCVLISTSGTTGLPKQAIVPWQRFMGGGLVGALLCDIQPVTARHCDVLYTAMPLYHGTAFLAGFGLSLTRGSTLAISRRFSVSGFWHEVEQNEATVIQYVGEAMRYLLAAPAKGTADRNHKVRLAYGNGLRPEVWKQFKARFGIETIVEFYSATEGTFATWNVNRNDFSDGAISSMGKLLDTLLSRTLAVVKVDWQNEEPWRDPETGFCLKVAKGETGELLSKLDSEDPHSQFVGYYNNDKASSSKVLRNVLQKGDVWFRSGDVVKWDEEGRIWFSDRIGDTFRWKSENVSTMEVGEIIGYHPQVVEANVYGVTVPGHEGRAGCVAVLLKDSALEQGPGGVIVKPDVLRSLATHSRNSLAKYAVPVFLRVVREMVTTGNNKTLKHIFRSQGVNLEVIRDAGSGDQIYWLQPGVERYVKFEPQHWAALNQGQVRL